MININNIVMINIIEKIFAAGKITRIDQISLNYYFLSQKAINREENRILRKLVDYIQMGFIQVVD